MSLLPNRFLVRVAYPCRHLSAMPREDDERLLELPDSFAIDNFAAMDDRRNYADVRLAWNEFGLGIQVEVRGKEQVPQGDVAKPRGSDGVTFWIDTRDSRTSHRASRYCHQFHLLATGGGPDGDEPAITQTKINRALNDAPMVPLNSIPFRVTRTKSGYIAEVFFPAAALNGFDPNENPRMGFYYGVRDAELGDQFLSVGNDFPYWEDPSLWCVLELVK